MTLIGLSGRARHGKTTVANAMMAYADRKGWPARIYDIGQEVLRFCIETERLPSKARKELTRDELQTLVNVGFEKRQENASFWLDRIAARMYLDRPYLAIVPNIRYANEAQWIRSENGRLIRVVALNENGSEYISPDRDCNHPSETELQFYPADYYITAKRGQINYLNALAVAILEDALCLNSTLP